MKYTEILHQNYHLQGFTSDGEYMYWSSTDTIVKTRKSGTVICQIYVPNMHCGDIDYYNGRLYVTALGTSFTENPFERWTSFSIHVYDAVNLSLVEIIRLKECYDMYATNEDGFRGVDGITVGVDPETGTPALMVASLIIEDERYDKNLILQYGFDGKLQKKHYINTGNTCLGIQNLDYDEATGKYWFTTYGGRTEYPFQNKNFLFHLDHDLKTVKAEYNYCTPVGFHCLGNGKYYASFQDGVNGNKGGYAFEVNEDDLKTPLYGEEYNKIKEKFDKIGL